ncbi:MAG: PAS domain S-box protein [Deltaproteobacteria bacterium]|nr:PAS domain S-box protein [Deltaproteobacteria bacterium]
MNDKPTYEELEKRILELEKELKKPEKIEKNVEGFEKDTPVHLAEYKRVEDIITTLYDISKAVCSTKNLDELFVSIHQSLGKIIDARNFSISLYDREKDAIRFAYYSGHILDVQSVSNASQSGTLVSKIILSKQPCLFREEQINEIYGTMPVKVPSQIPKSWIGVPLMIDKNLMGVLILRNYDDLNSYQLKDIELLESVSGQIAIAIDRKRAEDSLQKAYDEMEEHVRTRTMALEEVNVRLIAEIQEREKAQEVLRLSEEKFSKAFHSSPSLMSIATLEEGKFIDVNETLLKAHGYDREEVIGHTAVELGILASENRQRVLEMLKHGPVHNLEVHLRDKKGRLIHGSFSADIIIIEDEPCMLAVVDDITERIEREKAIREGEEKYRAIFENSPVGIALTSMDGRFLTVNQAILNMSGYSYDEIHELPLSVLYTDYEARKTLMDLVNRKGVAFNFPAQFKRKDGTVIDTLLTTTKVHHSGGDEIFQSFCIDVSEQIKMEKEKEELKARLEQTRRMDAITTLAGGVAHQVNNALSTIIGNLELLSMDLPDNERISRYSGPVKRSVYRMAHLSDQLLAYARGGKYHPQFITPNQFIRDTIPLIQHTIRPSVFIETDLPNDIQGIQADLTQMQMVLSAILSNASEAMEDQGRIRISCRNEDMTIERQKTFPELRPGPYVHLVIADDGKGMDTETMNRVFEPFFSTKLYGRGLGMAAVYGIIHNHNGCIAIESEEGKGTKVHIYLPAVGAQSKENDRREPVERPIKGSGTILIVEDEETVMDVSCAMLKRLGYRVLEAMSGKEAIDIVRTFNEAIDLVILDIILPDMEGKAIYPVIKEIRPDIKVILCSGYSSDGPAQEILDAGAQAFIQKPFSINGLSEKVKKVLEGF